MLDKAGVTWSVTKSDWEPSQIVAHIGFVWNFKRNVFSLTPRRLEKIAASLELLSVEGTSMSHLELASAAGRCMSASLLLGDLVRVLLRPVYAVLTPPHTA